MPITHRAADRAQAHPDRNHSFPGWYRPSLPRDAATLDRLADAELAAGRHHAADRLAWLAAGIRDGAPA